MCCSFECAVSYVQETYKDAEYISRTTAILQRWHDELGYEGVIEPAMHWKYCKEYAGPHTALSVQDQYNTLETRTRQWSKVQDILIPAAEQYEVWMKSVNPSISLGNKQGACFRKKLREQYGEVYADNPLLLEEAKLPKAVRQKTRPLGSRFVSKVLPSPLHPLPSLSSASDSKAPRVMASYRMGVAGMIKDENMCKKRKRGPNITSRPGVNADDPVTRVVRHNTLTSSLQIRMG